MPLGAARLSLLAYQATVAAAGRTAISITANGNAQVDTSQSKFGGASAYFDGTGDYLSASAGDVPAFGTGDFTLEYWLRLDVLGSTYGYMYWDQRPGSNGNYPLMFTDANGATNLRYFINGADRIVAPSGTLSVDTWHHIAVVRNSGTTKMYVDGVQKGSSYTDSTDYQAGRLHLGANMNGINSLDGWLDEIRASSIARYTGNFTPPTSAFTNDSDTLLLIHADGTDSSTTFTDDNVDPFATGGFTTELTVSGTNYRFHVFDSDSTDDFVASGAGTVDVMLIGGGGGGLGGQFTLQAGGGAGKVLLNSGVSVSSQSYTITAGTGATGGTQNATISNGGTTSAFGFTAIGGDSVSSVGTYNAQNGGDSGNGYSGGTGFDYSGYNTWDAGGGGAGATSNGSNAVSSSSPTSTNGTGGNGYDLTSFIGSGNTLNLRSSNLIPSSLIVAEGGNGARSTSADSTSFGSGSDGLYDTTIGGNGKSGAVIIRYAI